MLHLNLPQSVLFRSGVVNVFCLIDIREALAGVIVSVVIVDREFPAAEGKLIVVFDFQFIGHRRDFL